MGYPKRSRGLEGSPAGSRGGEGALTAGDEGYLADGWCIDRWLEVELTDLGSD